MARAWVRGDLEQVSGLLFQIQNLPSTAVLIVFHNGMRLRQVAIAPGVQQYVRNGIEITLGLEPGPGADIWFIYSTEEDIPPALIEAVGAAQAFLTRFNETFYFQVFIRDQNRNLLDIITEQVDGISWGYARVGGCTDAQIVLRRPFDDLRNVDEDHHIEIWRDVDKLGQAGAALPAFFGPDGIQLGTSHIGARELRWSGYIARLEPTLTDYEHVQLTCLGWASRLERLGVVNATPYVNQDIGVIVRDIIDNFAIPGSYIKRTDAFALVPNTGIIVPSIAFRSTIADALRTLATMAGDAEWGCDARGEFYFLLPTQVVKQTHAIGHKIKLYQPLKNSDDVVDRVYLQGVDGLLATINLGPYQSKNQKERFVTTGAVGTSEEATLWAQGYAVKFGPGVPVSQRLSGKLKLGATAKWIEGVGHPLGLLRVVGGPVFVAGGERFSAQLDFELANVYGGVTDQAFRVNNLRYTMMVDNYDIDIELGARSNWAADRFTAIESKLSELRQAQQ